MTTKELKNQFCRKNIIIIGGIATGKTTLLQSLINDSNEDVYIYQNLHELKGSHLLTTDLDMMLKISPKYAIIDELKDNRDYSAALNLMCSGTVLTAVTHGKSVDGIIHKFEIASGIKPLPKLDIIFVLMDKYKPQILL